MRRVLLGALVALAQGCIAIPDQATPQCYTDSDCNAAAGEVCAENICYGDPPVGRFAVSVVSPVDRPDLTNLERADEDLPAYGFLADLTLEGPVAVAGRVTAASCVPPTAPAACPTGALGATIRITRASRFPGGDGVQESGRSTGGDATTSSFSLAVPRSQPADADFVLTVVPDDRAGIDPVTGPAPAELVPPLRTTLRALGDLELPLALGGDDLPVITGDLVDAEGSSLSDYRISAIGRWTGDTADAEVSSVAYTTDGHFQIVLAPGLAGPVTIVARPTSSAMVVLPTLQRVGVAATTSSTVHLAEPALLGTQSVTTLTIEGTTGAGAVLPRAGARVIATATAALTGDPTDQAIVTAEVTTGDDGVAQLPLLDGPAFAAGYHLRIVPPAGSNLAILDESAFTLADGAIVLKPRISLQGTVVDAAGKPVTAVSVTVRPSLHFQYELSDASQAFLAQVPAATFVTADDGNFVVFVDPTLEAIAGRYDIQLEPPSGSVVPGYTVSDFAIPDGTVGPAQVSLGTVTLPAAAALHGRISDPGGNAVEGAELRVFRRPAAGSTLCALPHAPAGCQVPAALQAQATSDRDGIVRFTLPRTP